MQRGLARAIVASVLGAGIMFSSAGAAFAGDFPDFEAVDAHSVTVLDEDGIPIEGSVDLSESTGPAADDDSHPKAIAPAAKRVLQGTRKWTTKDYIRGWAKANGREMTDAELEHFRRGCIGVSVVNIEGPYANPPLDLAFWAPVRDARYSRLSAAEIGFNKSVEVAKAYAEIFDKNLSREETNRLILAHPLLSQLKNNLPRWGHYGSLQPKDLKPVIFSQRYWDGDDNGTPPQFTPDPKTGQVNMSSYRYVARPGYVNFDFGWYDSQTDNWWHANHMEYPDERRFSDPMYVYQSTLAYYSRPLLDFDGQVFGVAFGRRARGETAFSALPKYVAPRMADSHPAVPAVAEEEEDTAAHSGSTGSPVTVPVAVADEDNSAADNREHRRRHRVRDAFRRFFHRFR